MSPTLLCCAVLVSPSLLMLAIHVIQQIRRDARMREAADRIHVEVAHLMSDIERLHDRVLSLQNYSTSSFNGTFTFSSLNGTTDLGCHDPGSEPFLPITRNRVMLLVWSSMFAAIRFKP